jgi:hypothetical protein
MGVELSIGETYDLNKKYTRRDSYSQSNDWGQISAQYCKEPENKVVLQKMRRDDKHSFDVVIMSGSDFFAKTNDGFTDP